MNRLLAVVAALLTAWLGIPQAGFAAPVSSNSVVAYHYDGRDHPAPIALISDRGPPTHDHHVTTDAVDRWSNGASVGQSRRSPIDGNTYDDRPTLEQAASVTGTTRRPVGVADAVPVAFDRASVAANAGARLEIQLGTKIEGQLGKRGWTRESVQDLINNPSRTVATRDTRYLPGGGRNDAPATGYISRTGGYVVRNDETGDIVQVSNLNDPNWKSPW